MAHNLMHEIRSHQRVTHPVPECKSCRIAADGVVKEAGEVLEEARALIADVDDICQAKGSWACKDSLIEVEEVVGGHNGAWVGGWEA